MSKIDQVSHRLTCDTQVVEHLRFMLGGQFADRFELDHNTTKDVEIGDIAFLELSSFVKNGQFLLGAKGDGSQTQFYLKAFRNRFPPANRCRFRYKLQTPRPSADNPLHEKDSPVSSSAQISADQRFF